MTEEKKYDREQGLYRIRDREGIICRMRKGPDGLLIGEWWDFDAQAWRESNTPWQKILGSFFARDWVLDQVGVPLEDRGPWRGDGPGVAPPDPDEPDELEKKP